MWILPFVWSILLMYVSHLLGIPAIGKRHGKIWRRKRRDKNESEKREFESAVTRVVADDRAEARVRFEILQRLIEEAVIFPVALAAGAAYLAYSHVGQQALAALFSVTTIVVLLMLMRRSRRRFALGDILDEAQRRLDEGPHPDA